MHDPPEGFLSNPAPRRWFRNHPSSGRGEVNDRQLRRPTVTYCPSGCIFWCEVYASETNPTPSHRRTSSASRVPSNSLHLKAMSHRPSRARISGSFRPKAAAGSSARRPRQSANPLATLDHLTLRPVPTPMAPRHARASTLGGSIGALPPCVSRRLALFLDDPPDESFAISLGFTGQLKWPMIRPGSQIGGSPVPLAGAAGGQRAEGFKSAA